MNKQTGIEAQNKFSLPPELAGSSDLTRLIRELEELDDFLYQASIREPGTAVQPPKTSRMLEALSEVNNYSLLNQGQRANLLEALKHLDEAAPVVHISFSVEPSPKSLKTIVSWMREHLHQYLLIEVGLQPTIAIGCVVRTNNRIFDMSLRHKFAEYRSILIDKLAEREPQPAQSQPEQKQPEPEPTEAPK